MIQIIDLERYVFNFSKYDIYTNSALSAVPKLEFESDKHQESVRKSYFSNNYIFDKSLHVFKQSNFPSSAFVDESEFEIMKKIIDSRFVYDIKTFSQIFETYLPKKYLIDSGYKTRHFYLDLDNDSLRKINVADVTQ